MYFVLRYMRITFDEYIHTECKNWFFHYFIANWSLEKLAAVHYVTCVFDLETPREPSLVLILKWGGELTPAGRLQAEELGRIFRMMYPGGHGKEGNEETCASCRYQFKFKLSANCLTSLTHLYNNILGSLGLLSIRVKIKS